MTTVKSHFKERKTRKNVVENENQKRREFEKLQYTDVVGMYKKIKENIHFSKMQRI